MLREMTRRRIAALRQPHQSVRVARALWTCWAIIVWNVVFDRVIVVAGRSYIRAAAKAAMIGGPYARMDDWMLPAVTRAFWMATGVSLAMLIIGFALIALAAPSLLAPASQPV